MEDTLINLEWAPSRDRRSAHSQVLTFELHGEERLRWHIRERGDGVTTLELWAPIGGKARAMVLGNVGVAVDAGLVKLQPPMATNVARDWATELTNNRHRWLPATEMFGFPSYSCAAIEWRLYSLGHEAVGEALRGAAATDAAQLAREARRARELLEHGPLPPIGAPPSELDKWKAFRKDRRDEFNVGK